MGLFNHLFKNKPPQGGEGMEERRQTTPLEGGAESADAPPPDLTIFLHPKAYVPRGGAAPVHPGARPAGHTGGKPAERRTLPSTPPVTGEIVLTLGDVLSRIPTQLLKHGAHDAKRELRFKIGDLSSDIARGRAVVPLSRIAALCPDIFQKEITVAEDMDIRLPLQKLVEQIGLLRSNSPAPLPEKVVRAAPSEAPSGLLPTRVPLAMRTPAVAPRQTPAARGESKPATPGALEIKQRAASAPFAPPEISKALQENILKAQPAPMRRIPAESRHGIPEKQESANAQAQGGDALATQSDEAATSEKVIPFPAIAAKAETGPPKMDEDSAELSAESALEEKLRQLLAQKAEGESAVKPELMAPSDLVTALAEIALQQSLLNTVEAKEAPPEGVSLAQAANKEGTEESNAKLQLLSLLRMRLDAGDEAAAVKMERPALPVLESLEAAEEALPVETESKPMESRVAETAKAPAAAAPFDVTVSKAAPAAVVDVEMPGKVIAPKEAEARKPEIREAEAFEEKREAPAMPEALEESVPKADAIFARHAEISHAEASADRTEPKKSDVSAPQALEATPGDLASEGAVERISKANQAPILPAEIPQTQIPNAAELKGSEVSAAEVFEDTLKAAAAAALLKGIISKAESVSPPKPGIIPTENARKEPESRKEGVKAVEADEAAPTEFAQAKHLAEPVLTAETSAAPPAEPPSSKSAPKEMESKRTEASAVEVFEDAMKPHSAPPVLHGIGSNEESISPPDPGIIQTEIARKEPELGKAEIKAVEADEAAPTEFAQPKHSAEQVVTAETFAAPPEEPPSSKSAPKEMESKRTEASAVEVFEDPLKLKETEPRIEVVKTEQATGSAPGEVAKLKISAQLFLKADASVALPGEPSPGKFELKEAESKAPEVSAVEAFEDTLSAIAASAPPGEIVSNREPIISSRVESLTPELPLKATETKNPEASEAAVFERTQNQPATTAEAMGGVADALASIPLEAPHTKTPPQRPDLKKSQVSPPGLFEETVKALAKPEISEVSVSKPAPIPLAEIAHKEATPRHKDSTALEPGASAARERTPEESVSGSILQSEPAEPAAPLAMAPIHSDMVPLGSVSGTLEAGVHAASASPELDESSKMPALPGADEIDAKVAPEHAVLAEAPISKLSGEARDPKVEEPAVATQKDESLAALLVSLTALTGSAPEPSADSAIPADEESPTHGTDDIWLSLPALLKNCPKEIFAGELPQIPGNLGIELPIAQIEPQLASGSVEISSLRFIAALPPAYMQYFVVREDVKVSIPMEVILRNLPYSVRERFERSAKALAHAGGEQLRAEVERSEAEPAANHPIAPALLEEKAHAAVGAGAEAPSDTTAVIPLSMPSVPEPTSIEISETAQKSEREAPQPEAPDAALAEAATPEASSEPTSSHAEPALESSWAEMPGAVAPSEEPGAAADAQEGSAEPAPQEAPEPEAIKPFALHIPVFRVFAPPPLHVNASIASAPAASVPLAWAGHVSTQPPRTDEPRQEEHQAPHPPTPQEETAPEQEAGAKSLLPDLEASLTPGLAPPFEGRSAVFATTPKDSTQNADAAKGQHLHAPAVPSGTESPEKEDSFLPGPAQPAQVSFDPAPRSDAPSGRTPELKPSAFSVEGGGADISWAAAETQTPEGSQAASDPSTPSGERTALIRPPMIRPVAIAPPPIIAFNPGVAPQPAESLSEKSPATEAAPKESAPESRKAESVPNDPATAVAESRNPMPRIAGNSAGERAPIPAPPKIPISVPKLPVLHFPPAPKPEAQNPAAEPLPVPPLPLVRFDQDVLQTLFMTDEFLDLSAICRHVSALPGIQACVISRRDEKASAGEMPSGFEFSELLSLAPGVLQMAGRLPIGALKHFTLYAETHSVSFFERHGVCLCVVHRSRSFIPGVREKLVTVADELSK